MKVEEVPQDLKYFKGVVIRDQEYAVDDQGRYQMVESDGWTPKNASKNFMDIDLLSTYSGFSKRTIRKHFNPKVFAKLDKEVLSKYAEVLRITVDELTSIPE